MHMHAHAHTCTHAHAHGKHDNFMQMAASIGFLGNPWEFPMMSYVCVRVCMHVQVHVCVGAPSHHPPPPSTHPPTPQGGPSESVKIQ